MERMIDTETEELSKREKYRERRGEEHDVVSNDYATGDSYADGTNGNEVASESAESTQEPVAEAIATPEPTADDTPQGTTYILNTNTKKFRLPSCSSVKQMKDANKETYTGSRDDVVAKGYTPCKKCNP